MPHAAALGVSSACRIRKYLRGTPINHLKAEEEPKIENPGSRKSYPFSIQIVKGILTIRKPDLSSNVSA
jgi:hypothetical protein